MMLPATTVLVSLASNLAYDLLKIGSARLYRSAVTDSQHLALQRAYEHAFARMVHCMMEDVSTSMQSHIADILRRFVASEEVSELLLDIALSSEEPPLSKLRDRFEELGFDTSTLPVDFDTGMCTFVIGLAEGLRLEAARSQSPLFNQVALARLTAIEVLLEQNKLGWAAAVNTLQELEQSLVTNNEHAVSSKGIAIFVDSNNASAVEKAIVNLPESLQTIGRDIHAVLENININAERRAIQDAQSISEYLTALFDYCNQLPYVTLPGKPLPLLSTIYIEQRSEEQLPDAEVEAASTERLERSIDTIDKALLRHRHLIIEGGPGMGKSTMLHHLSLTLIKNGHGGNSDALVPVRVFARDLVMRSGSLSESLQEQVSVELGKRLTTAIPPRFFARPPPGGANWLVMIDGLDEIISQTLREELIHAITLHARNEQSHYRFVLTTRPLTSTNWFDRNVFGYYVVLPFEPTQVKTFAENWFANRPGFSDGTGANFLAEVQKSRIEDIARIPLLVTMAVVVYERDRARELPNHRIDLYDRFVKVLLEDEEHIRETRESLRIQWDRRYGSEGRLIADNLFNKRLLLLEHLAEWQQAGHAGSFIKESVTHSIAEDWIPPGLDMDWLHQQIDTLLRRTGLIFKRGDEEAFIHTSFREYFTALALARRYQASDADSSSAINELARENWWEIIVFLLVVWSRRGEDLNPVLNYLLENHGDAGLLFSGTALGEGAEIAKDFDAAIVGKLLTYARKMNNFDIQSSPNPLTVLAKLSGREQVVKGLESLVCDSKVNVLAAELAVQSLLQLGDSHTAVKALMFLARSNDTYQPVRKKAMKTLAQLNLVSELLSLVRDKTLLLTTRLSAFGELRLMGVAEDIDLESFMDQPGFDVATRLSAAQQLDQFGKSAEAIEIWSSIISDSRIEIGKRVLAAKHLCRTDKREEALQFLCDIAQDPEQEGSLRLSIAHSFASHQRQQAYSQMILRLANDLTIDSATRLNATKQLNEFGKTVHATRAWSNIARDVTLDSTIRFLALEQLDKNSETVLADQRNEILSTIALDSNVETRFRVRAAQSLYKSSEDGEVFQLLYQLAQNPTIPAIKRLKIAIDLKPNHPESAASILLALLHDSEVASGLKTKVSKELYELTRMENASPILLVIRGLTDAAIGQKTISPDDLNKSGFTDHEIDAWFSLIYNAALSVSIRLGLIEPLLGVSILENDALSILSSMIQDSSVSLEDRIKALKILERSGRVVNLLEVATSKTVDTVVQKESIKAVGRVGDQRALAALNRLANVAREKSIRRVAKHAIEHIQKRLENYESNVADSVFDVPSVN
jgi:DNA polymerase III delta prime subunit